MTAHRLAGHLGVDASARRIRHYRFVEERMMRILGGWIALTPELPAKLLFGRHVWDCAQHADAWGRRLPELRAPAQTSEPAGENVVRLMALLESPEAREQTVERVVGVYGVLKPHLATVYARHLERTNAVYEPPTRRILAVCLEHERRHAAAGRLVLDRLLQQHPEARRRAAAWEARLREALTRAGGVTGDAESPLIAPLPPVDPVTIAQDLVPAPPPFDGGRLPAELAETVEAHARALAAGDVAGALRQVAETARERVRAAYGALGAPFDAARVVGVARIGAYRIVKLRLERAAAAAVVQARWTPSPSGWRVTAAEVLPG
jgi:hypothetical protein